MANRLISPSLADIDQDIAGIIPIDLILQWSLGKKTPTYHTQLLEPYLVKGIVVSSDSAGLSKMSASKTLFEVMKLVSQPKEVIFSFGTAIGGTAVGTWAADNTQMLYGEQIEANAVLEQMLAAQNEINDLLVRVGLGIHAGEFISIGGGLFGHDAELVEELAENNTEGGEVAVSEAFRNRVDGPLYTLLTPKAENLVGNFFSVEPQARPFKAHKTEDVHYPYPFTQDFFELLRMSEARPASMDTYNKYTQEKIVILVKIGHAPKSLLLDTLSEWVLANTILKKIRVLTEIQEVKSNGNLGIFVTDNVAQAIEFSIDLRDTLTANGYIANVGIAKGEVLLFPLKNELTEIAGAPVNIASKLAEDSGQSGKVFIENTVNLKGQRLPEHQAFKIKLSAIELGGISF